MDVAATLSASSAGATTASTAASGAGLNQMTSDDFLKVLITQLQYQDPFKPMDNEQMLNQMSQIRNMEMSTTLTDSLRTLTEQQRLGSAATLIGQYVTGVVTGADGSTTTVYGVVRGIRFQRDGQPILDLESGGSLPLKALQNVTDPNRFVGKYVEGNTIDADGKLVPISGVVATVGYTTNGEAWLVLTSGDALPLANVTRVSNPPVGTDSASSQSANKDGDLTAKLMLGK